MKDNLIFDFFFFLIFFETVLCIVKKIEQKVKLIFPG